MIQTCPSSSHRCAFAHCGVLQLQVNKQISWVAPVDSYQHSVAVIVTCVSIKQLFAGRMICAPRMNHSTINSVISYKS